MPPQSSAGYSGTPLSDVMPVQIEGPPVPDSVTFFAELKVVVTPPGRSSAVTQIAPTVARWFDVQLSPEADRPLELAVPASVR